MEGTPARHDQRVLRMVRLVASPPAGNLSGSSPRRQPAPVLNASLHVFELVQFKRVPDDVKQTQGIAKCTEPWHRNSAWTCGSILASSFAIDQSDKMSCRQKSGNPMVSFTAK
jgi:hypothetical protein